jgi:integrase
LKRTLETANTACNYISQVAWDTKTFGKFQVQKLVYGEARGRFGLSAQLALRCIAKVTERSITRRVGELGERIGIDNLSAHDLRHSWATRAIRKGSDPFALQQAGGWTSMQTVRKYVDESAIANEGVNL